MDTSLPVKLIWANLRLESVKISKNLVLPRVKKLENKMVRMLLVLLDS
jgi:hypothetical protein